jgi:hypothetical protein
VTPEAKVKKAVKEVLTNLGAYFVMPVTGGFGNSGAPDFLVCLGGRFIGIECKAKSYKMTDLQTMNGVRILEAGGNFILATDQNVKALSAIIIWSIFRD